MYYIVYGLLYLFSLLPFFVLYGISSFIAFLLHSVFRYRKAVVLSNLQIVFPEKEEKERKEIAKKFYRNFTDTFVETIKTLSISDKEFDKRCTGNFDVINEVVAKGKNIQVISAHTFNWELANLALSKHMKLPSIGVYSPIESKITERLFLKIRARFGTILIPTHAFKRRMHELMKAHNSMFLLADQNPNPGNVTNAYWLSFFGKTVPFISGPHRAASKNNSTILFISFRKLKRGYYSFDATQVIEDAGRFTPQELTIRYRDFVEGAIRIQPDNYLWSHRRWRRQITPEFEKNRIEN